MNSMMTSTKITRLEICTLVGDSLRLQLHHYQNLLQSNVRLTQFPLAKGVSNTGSLASHTSGSLNTH